MFNKKVEKMNLNDFLEFNDEIELNILVKKLINGKPHKNIRIEVAIESLLRSLIYYVYSIKPKEERTLKQVVVEIDLSQSLIENKDYFVDKLENFPIDHPARIYWREVSCLKQDEIKECFKIAKDRIKSKTK